MKDVKDGFISINEAVKRSGLPRRAVVARLDASHPDPIPCLRFPNLGTRPSYRIPEQEFEQWLEDHRP